MKLLTSNGAFNRLAYLARRSERLDAVTFNIHSGADEILSHCRNARVIVGVPEEGERWAVIDSKIQAYARRFSKHEFRSLRGSHIKLYSFQLINKQKHALFGSMNFGEGHYHELMCEVEGELISALSTLFEGLWKRSLLVKPLALDSDRIQSLSNARF